jgi:hypothetical protein
MLIKKEEAERSSKVAVQGPISWTTLIHTDIQISIHVSIPAVHTAPGYGLGGRGSVPVRGKRFFSTPERPDRHWGPTQPPIQWVPDGGGEFPRG